MKLMAKSTHKCYLPSMELNRIKRLALQAVVSDDYLMETLVLKGGNAIDLIYKVAQRASLDLDFSMSGDFDQETLAGLENRISSQLSRTFEDAGFHVLDVTFSERPSKLPDDLRGMWGGYEIQFKVISKETLEKLGDDIEAQRRNATQLGPGSTSKFSIEISRYEQCEPKVAKDLDGYTIFVYTPALLVIEKLRAICQQRSDYKTIISSATSKGRARDFFDICVLMDNFDINLFSNDNRQLLWDVFAIKKVPLEYLKEIHQDRDFHRLDFPSIQDTVHPETDLRDFDFYFDRVIGICDNL